MSNLRILLYVFIRALVWCDAEVVSVKQGWQKAAQ